MLPAEAPPSPLTLPVGVLAGAVVVGTDPSAVLTGGVDPSTVLAGAVFPVGAATGTTTGADPSPGVTGGATGVWLPAGL